MAKKENGRELLRQDNDSLRKQFVDCRKLLESERARTELYEKALKEIVNQNGLMKFLDDNDWATSEDYFAYVARKALKD